MDFRFDAFIEACERDVAAPGGLERIRERLAETVQDGSAIGDALPAMTGDEMLLHASERLVVVHLRLSPNVHYPPHEHGMEAIVGIYAGTEHSISYRLEHGRPVAIGEHDAQAGEVTILPGDAIHSVANAGESFSYGLHVYAGDLIHQPRHIWHPETGEAHPYSDECYFEFARPWDARRPYVAPDLCLAHADGG